ncbi:MAG: hypothetical protein GY765_18160 [bacterium]|nr:hypothetical protein [bacterium]
MKKIIFKKLSTHEKLTVNAGTRVTGSGDPLIGENEMRDVTFSPDTCLIIYTDEPDPGSFCQASRGSH